MLGFLKKNNNMLELFAPMDGEIIDISNVEDQVFSKKMVGDGIAIIPTDGLVVAPCDGKILQIFSTNHAVGIETKEGLEILIHLGLDTVELKGEGFTRLAETGMEVKTGDPLIKMDLERIKELGKSTVSPVLITNVSKTEEIKKEYGPAKAKSTRIMSVKVKNS